MKPTHSPSLRLFLARHFAAGGPLVTWVLCQPAGGAIAYAGTRVGARPSAVTLLGLLAGVAGCTVLAVAERGVTFAAAGTVLVLSYLCDCADGQLARATGTSSERGAWLDVLCDGAIVVCLALAVAHQGERGSTPLLVLGASALLGAGRMASLVTGTMARRSPDRDEWTSRGLTLAGRRAYLAVMDTPVVYVTVAAAASLRAPLALVAGGLGAAALLQALVVGRHTFSALPVGERRPSV